MSTEGLLEGGQQPSAKLSISSIGKIKRKVSDWRLKAHEHALEQAMAVGMGCMHHGKIAGAKWKKDATSQDGVERKDSIPDAGQSNTEAVTNLLNNCLGSGVLAVPLVVKEVGIATAMVMLVVSAVLNRFGLMLVLKCCDVANIDVSYNTIGRVAYGAVGRAAVVSIFIAMGFGCLVSYVDATADAVGAIITAITGVDLTEYRTYLQLSMVFLLYPPTYIRSLKNIAPISMASFLGALVVVACVAGRCFTDLLMQGFPAASSLRWTPPNLATFLKFLPTCLTVFSIQAGGSITLSALKDPSPKNKSLVSLIAYIIVLSVNTSVALPSYLRFRDQTQGDVLSSFDPSDPVIIFAKVCVLDLIVPSYMFMMIPCRVALIEILFGKNEAKMEATYTQFLGVTTCVNIAAVSVALVVSDLSLVIGLVGAIAANSVAFILPSLFYMKVRSQPKNPEYTAVPIFSVQNIGFYLLILASFGSMFLGVYMLVA